ncbi:peptidase [Mycobacterium colombiense]|uniref:nitroreductase family deazaflavin-dependent oxidoreductase n=1 Tax=Mycobacterium colombiense TaxID=339268 RepID=UPI0007ED953A|nr:nitroreductase family deazaflavin-dependent oxidoreductase [Mycobacterium colombiense]OBJ12988.1 peptidase [Mycobacterium colombiense]OBJ24713.1 peptidase [Mycobacterium colombiense]OBJ44704.1 peptidase [Mycobacterium colombiense]OBJ78400.1 peptidase [Mycobacterium colombiense]
MRVPRAVANFNSQVTNPAARSITPWLPGLCTLEHVGRKSGRRYRTPLLVFPIREGFVFLIGYGPHSDWVKNVLAGGRAVLHRRGRSIGLVNPRLVSKAEGAAIVSGPSGMFYRMFPYNEAAMVLTKVDSTH